jgi:hypothetical protein
MTFCETVNFYTRFSNLRFLVMLLAQGSENPGNRTGSDQGKLLKQKENLVKTSLFQTMSLSRCLCTEAVRQKRLAG